MKKVGEILQETRRKRKLTLEHVAQATKIRLPLLQAIEAGDQSKLPNPAYTRGLVTNYATLLGLDPKHILAFFRREFAHPTPQESPQSFLPPGLKSTTFFDLSLQQLSYLAIALIFIVALAFLGRQYWRYGRKPTLIVTQPPNQLTISRPALTVSGRTDPDSKVLINGQAALVDANGFFSLNLLLTQGLQKIEVVAEDRQGLSSTIERIVKIEVPSEGQADETGD